jgi:lambda repressor-like predicted transcriptional regulator
MSNRPAPALVLREGDREKLARLMRSSSVRAGLARRARIVLLAAEGLSNTLIADLVGVSRPTVIGWRERYQAGGIAGLEDEHRSGRPRIVLITPPPLITVISPPCCPSAEPDEGAAKPLEVTSVDRLYEINRMVRL